MKVTTKNLRRCDVVIAEGRIDSSTVKILAQTLASIKDAGRYKIVLNMKDVTFISSAGLGELVDTQKTCRYLKRGELVLAELPLKIEEVLDLTGLKPLFKIFDNDIEAVGSF
ncbi:STAS domain-containing protein [Anaerolineales bacterium HSG24]|nr:STAS domain-containing protein [Anaerolineales bacterium HSG24]